MMYFIDEQPIELPEEELSEETAAEVPAVEEDAPPMVEETDELVTEPVIEELPEEELSEETAAEVPAVEEDAPQMVEETDAQVTEPVLEELPEEAGDETPVAEEIQASTEDETSAPDSEFGIPDEEDEEEDDGRLWFVIHCYSGYENKVRHNLEQRIESMDMKDYIFDVVVPIEEEIEVKDGKRKTVERRVFPGYILVNMIMSEESWYVVRNTPGVTSFVGMGNEPIPLRKEEVDKIIKRMEADAPRVRLTFRKGERVRITDGPFNEFRGTVDEIDMDRAKVRVMVNFFGRNTPVELDFLQVEKA